MPGRQQNMSSPRSSKRKSIRNFLSSPAKRREGQEPPPPVPTLPPSVRSRPISSPVSLLDADARLSHLRETRLFDSPLKQHRRLDSLDEIRIPDCTIDWSIPAFAESESELRTNSPSSSTSALPVLSECESGLGTSTPAWTDWYSTAERLPETTSRGQSPASSVDGSEADSVGSSRWLDTPDAQQTCSSSSTEGGPPSPYQETDAELPEHDDQENGHAHPLPCDVYSHANDVLIAKHRYPSVLSLADVCPYDREIHPDSPLHIMDSDALEALSNMIKARSRNHWAQTPQDTDVVVGGAGETSFDYWR